MRPTGPRRRWMVRFIGDILYAMNIEGPYDGTQKAGASFIYLAQDFADVTNASDDAQMTIYGQTRNGYSSSFAGSLGDLSGDGFRTICE